MSARKGIALGIFGILLALLGWRVLSAGMAAHLAEIDPVAGLGWNANDGEAQILNAELNSKSTQDPARQDRRARAAIRSAPLDARGYRLLAQRAEQGGRLDVAARLYSLAVARGPRDLQSAAWITERALMRADYSTAITHLDRMLRVEPELARKVFPAMVAIVGERSAHASLVATLRLDPPWRASFVLFMLQQSQDNSALFSFMERLRAVPDGLSQAELSAWLDRLTRDQLWGAAYLTWVESLSTDASRQIGNVYNGSFEHEPSMSGFDWRLTAVPGARISRAQVTGADGALALRLAFEDRRVPFQHVRQQLALAPGNYRLQGRVRLDDLRSDRGLVWSITCAEKGELLAETEPMSGRTSWRSFSVAFFVPVEGCGGQWITLRIPARIAAEQLIGGVVWFDDLKIGSGHVQFTD